MKNLGFSIDVVTEQAMEFAKNIKEIDEQIKELQTKRVQTLDNRDSYIEEIYEALKDGDNDELHDLIEETIAAICDLALCF